MSLARRELGLASGLALCALAGCGKPSPPIAPPRRILFVSVQGLRADHLSCYGNPRPTSAVPSSDRERAVRLAAGIDDLAAEGVLFARAYAPSSSTVASLASLLTGSSTSSTGVVDDTSRIAPAVATLAEILSRAGFRTAAFATASRFDLRRSLGPGFKIFVTRASDTQTIDAAARWLEKSAGRGGGTFTWVHLSGLAPPRASRAYDPRVRQTSELIARLLRGAFGLDREARSLHGSWRSTLFVLTGTGGVDLSGATARDANAIDAALRVPLLIHNPTSLTGERVLAEVVELADIAPTALDWLGIRETAGMTGRSLLALADARGRRPFDSRPAFAVTREGALTARSRRWRLVWDPDGVAGVPATPLYDCDAEPLESQDIALRHPEVVQELLGKLVAWRTTGAARQRARPSPR